MHSHGPFMNKLVNFALGENLNSVGKGIKQFCFILSCASSNAPTARLPTYISETGRNLKTRLGGLNTNEPREMALPTITLIAVHH